MICFGGFSQGGSDLLPRRSVCWATFVSPPLGAFGLVPAAPGRRREKVRVQRSGGGTARSGVRAHRETGEGMKVESGGWSMVYY